MLDLSRAAVGVAGDKASVGLSGHLRDLGFKVTRLKTGTPARLHKDSIDWSKTTPQPGDRDFYPFGGSSVGLNLPQVNCYLSYTNERTHDIIRKNLDKSPLVLWIDGGRPQILP